MKLAWIAAALISGAGSATAAAESFTFMNVGEPGFTVAAQGAGGEGALDD